MRRLLTFSAAILAAAIATNVASAAPIINTYSSQASWAAAAGSPQFVENFNDKSLIPQITGISGTGPIGSQGIGLVDTGLFPNKFVSHVGPIFFLGNNTSTFTFSQPMSALGGNFDLSPVLPFSIGGNTGLTFELALVDGTKYILPLGQEVPKGLNGGFFGFTSSVPFTSVTILPGSQASPKFLAGFGETFTLDNLSLVPAAPEPASFVLFSLAIAGGLGYHRLRRRTKMADAGASQ